jgi:CubicO group peptidase (beta-lactamase class C family)
VPAVASNQSRLSGELSQVLAAAVERLGVPGAAVGIYVDGEEHQACAGVTSVENPLPVDPSTLFQAGSITKTVTATVLMRLVEQGRVRLEAPVRAYVPDFRVRDEDASARVTVLQLLNHTAGWRGDLFLDTGQGDDALASYVAEMARLEQLTPPGTTVSYNNAAYCLAGHLVEHVTGEAYEQAVRDLLLEPLGLHDSLFGPADVMTRRFAIGHVRRDGRMAVARPWHLPRSAHPAGGIAATAGDQLRYARFHLGRLADAGPTPVVTQATLDRMQRPTAEMWGGTLGDRVGIGWFMRDVSGLEILSHFGDTNGQAAMLQLARAAGFAIVVLTNSTEGAQLRQEVSCWALEACLGVVDREAAGPVPDSEALAGYAGVYHLGEDRVTVIVEDGSLVVSAPILPPTVLTIVSGDAYVVAEGPYRGVSGRFLRDSAGRVSAIDVAGRLARRDPAGEPPPSSRPTRSGTGAG